jgi:pimeloyl-ACP methyl ester carboxylesterase
MRSYLDADPFDFLDQVITEPASRATSEKNLLAHILRANGVTFEMRDIDPDKLYRELVFGRNDGRAKTIAGHFTVLAYPGERPQSPLQRGDILLRVALGYPGLGHVAVIADPTLWSNDYLASAPFGAERQEPGLYAVVSEAGADPHPPSQPFARRILDRLKRMLPSQILIRLKQPDDKPASFDSWSPLDKWVEESELFLPQEIISEYLEATPPATVPPARTTSIARPGFRPDLSVLCPPPPLILDKFSFDGDRPKAAHLTRIGTLAQEIVNSQTSPDPIHTLCILGHTDRIGAETYNQDLAARRAIAVANELETAIETRQPGLAATLGRTVESRGEEAPLVPNTSAANRERNRRVEIFLNRRWIPATTPVGACPTVAVATDDPTAPTPFAVGEETFSASISLFGASIPVSGTVFYPADSAGTGTNFVSTLTTPAPIVVFAHGNHATFRHPTDRFRESCDASSGFVPLENHRGYDYLQRLLAGMGMVAVSVDANATNCTGGSPTNIHLRGMLVLAALQHFTNLHTSGTSRFVGRLDLAKTALFGHSRGGEAVLVAAETLPTIPSLSSVARVQGVISLAPTDAGATSGRPNGFAFMTLLPAADGDVIDNDGAKFYDQATPSPFKCQIYIHGANHNFFNRNWALDEGHGAARLSRLEHERILSVYACAFFRNLLLGHNTVRFLRVDVLPPGVPTEKVQVSFESTGATIVDDHENRNISLNAVGAPTTQSAGLTAAEFDFQQGTLSSFNSSFFGKTVGMVVQTSSAGGLFRSQLASDTNLIGRQLWVRVAEVYNGTTVPSIGTGYQIGLEDAAGNTSFADSNDVGGLPRPFDRRADDLARLSHIFGAAADRTKTILKTQRFAAACFAHSGFDLTRVRAVLLRLDRGDNRALAFDQLQIV